MNESGYLIRICATRGWLGSKSVFFPRETGSLDALRDRNFFIEFPTEFFECPRGAQNVPFGRFGLGLLARMTRPSFPFVRTAFRLQKAGPLFPPDCFGTHEHECHHGPPAYHDKGRLPQPLVGRLDEEGGVGPARFELASRAPQARRIPSYPTDPERGNRQAGGQYFSVGSGR